MITLGRAEGRDGGGRGILLSVRWPRNNRSMMRHFLAELKGRSNDRSIDAAKTRGGPDTEKFGFGPGSVRPSAEHMIPPSHENRDPNESRFLGHECGSAVAVARVVWVLG